ncbi:substrate-binding periplasmic protein [Parachitinimonas caeni]|uniref:Transporter substrate-binding domain-containing protein n=1 Tax=Parachitinimonas caeni TaxID=3031301 RepID=A0ABT7DZ85_9NEIS|nr:transporter substrate-binding domain-containing protein [Parachitinimonas caeni]MDK2125375.1 transporter substrate-binding domain-containing protein [Parachitinimonas caeni]
MMWLRSGAALAWLLIMALIQPVRAEPLLVRLAYVDTDSPPFLNGNGAAAATPPGLAVELVQQAVTDAGFRLELVRLPQLRMLKMLEESQVDGAFIFSYTEERARKFIYPTKTGRPDPSLRATHIIYRAYRRKDGNASWNGNTFENLQKPVGANTGWVIVSTLREKGVEVDDGASGTQGNVGKLRLGRVDIYAGLEPTVDAYLGSNKIEDIEKTGPPLLSRDYYLIFSRNFFSESPAAAQRIWQKLAAVRERMEAQLYRQYQAGNN